MALFRGIFDHPPEGREGSERLFQLCQDDQTAAEYALTFQTVAAANGWNEPALCTLFRGGLREEVQTELACEDDNLSLDVLIAMAICLDNLHWEHRYPRQFSPSLSDHSVSDSEPLEVGVTRLPVAERRRC